LGTKTFANPTSLIVLMPHFPISPFKCYPGVPASYHGWPNLYIKTTISPALGASLSVISG